MSDPNPLILPPAFLAENEESPAWLKALPELVGDLAVRWGLRLGTPFPAVRINYVVPAWRADGTACVFKVSRHLGDTRNEGAALRLWDGDGAARLLAAEPDLGALLIERVEPGTLLAEVAAADDDAATRIAADVLRRIWRPATEPHGLRSLASWCDAYDRNREALERGERGFPAAVFRRADAMRRDLLASSEAPTVLHGDLHHYNILRATRAPWLTIDPKGLVGDRCFDVCQFFRNSGDEPPAVNRRRLDIFCAELGLDRERTRAWCYVHAVLDACWSFEDGTSWENSVAYAEETLKF
ncbi:MAG TPA: aminoglycoside phosphotransferase family protein [Chloroflexota bacterium]|nr:aminoglycoside phosphotransferase family protein [Chloroflexota bacterium]